jgi:ribonuclease VapC
MIVVDTGAVVAALSGEADGPRVNETLAGSAVSLMSAANYLECSIVLASRFGDDGVHDLRLYLHEAGIEIVPVDRDQADAALDAWMRYGKGRHGAALNCGDCFAYALASLRGARLLFVGDDFARTDAAADLD